MKHKSMLVLIVLACTFQNQAMDKDTPIPKPITSETPSLQKLASDALIMKMLNDKNLPEEKEISKDLREAIKNELIHQFEPLYSKIFGRPYREIKAPNHTIRVTFNPTDKPIIITVGNVYFWNPTTGKVQEAENKYASPIDFSNKHVTATSKGNIVLLWNIEDMFKPPVELKGHSGRIYSKKFSPDNKHLATASEDTTVRIWDLKTLTSKELKGHKGPVFMLAFSPDGKLLASVSNAEIILWDLKTNTPKKIDINSFSSMAFSPDSRYLAIAFGRKIQIWDIPTNKILQVLEIPTGTVLSLAFSHNGKFLLTNLQDSNGDTVRLWELSPESKLTWQQLLLIAKLSNDLTLLKDPAWKNIFNSIDEELKDPIRKHFLL